VGSICVTSLRLLIQNLWHLTWWSMETEVLQRPEDSLKAAVGSLAEVTNTEPLTSHLEISANDRGCVETGGQVEGTCGWPY
jgi:hypothetical protein